MKVVRLKSREWPDGDAWDIVAEVLFLILDRDLYWRIFERVARQSVDSGVALLGRQLDWGAWLAYFTRDEMLEFVGPAPPQQEGEAWWMEYRREDLRRIAALPKDGDYGLVAVEDV